MERYVLHHPLRWAPPAPCGKRDPANTELRAKGRAPAMHLFEALRGRRLPRATRAGNRHAPQPRRPMACPRYTARVYRMNPGLPPPPQHKRFSPKRELRHQGALYKEMARDSAPCHMAGMEIKDLGLLGGHLAEMGGNEARRTNSGWRKRWTPSCIGDSPPSIAPEGWGPKEGGNATSPLNSRGSPNKGGQNQKSKPPLGVTMMPLGAPSISKYGSLVQPDTQIVALRAHCA